MLAHIAGAPVEETVLSLAPVAFAATALASARLRRLVRLRPAHEGRSIQSGRSKERR